MKEKKPGTYYRERSVNQGLCLQGDGVLTKTVFGRCVPPLASVLPLVPLSLPALESPPALLSLILSKIRISHTGVILFLYSYKRKGNILGKTWNASRGTHISINTCILI